MNASPDGLAVLADPAYRPLKEYVIRSTGLAYYADKDADLAARVAQRLKCLGMADCTVYRALLEGDEGAAELDALIEDLTIGETFFFRHREMFDALRAVVFPELIARNAHRKQLRIWSAGCATGAEPYSVSILLRRDLASLLAGWDVSIVATDINRAFLTAARTGRFEEWAFRSTPEELRRACFERSGNTWVIKPEYRHGVSFQYHNLVTHPYPSLLNDLLAFDLILCRNVTIYFSHDIVRDIIGRFHQCLVDAGWLLVGHAEPNLELFRSFRTVNATGAVLYQRSPVPMSETASVPPLPGGWATWEPPVLPAAFPALVDRSDSSPDVVTSPRTATTSGASEVAPIRTHADRGEWEQAAACCEMVLERDKLNPVVYFYQALVLEQLRRHAEAENALRHAVYLDRRFVLAHYYLGLLLEKQGLAQPAVRSFRNVLELLTRLPAEQVLADGDGITAAELSKVTQLHLDVLESA